MTSAALSPNSQAISRAFWLALGANFLWINISEVARYFAFVMPMTREAFPMIADVAPMNLPVFMIWGVWDMILVVAATAMPWLILDKFGSSKKVAALAGVFVWMAVFVILWLGLFNMNLTTGGVLFTALPLALIEMLIAAFIVRGFCFRRAA